MSENANNSLPSKMTASQKGVEGAVEVTEPTIVVEKSDEALSVMRSAVIPPVEWAMRDILVNRIDIANTDTPFINLLGVFRAFEAWYLNSWVTAHATGYKYFRGTLVITANMVTPGSSFGAYVVQALCDGMMNPVGSGVDDAGVDDIHTSCSDVFGILNCETGNSVVLRLPFVCPFEAMSFDATFANTPFGNNGMWRLLLWPLTPLTSTINTSALGQVTFFAHMEDFEMEVHQFQGKKSSAPFKASLEKPVKKEQGRFGKIASTTATVAAAVSNAVPFLAPFAGPVAVGMGALATIADIFGFTRESSPTMPTPIIPKLTSTLATIDGIDPSEVLGLVNSNAVSIDPRIGGGTGSDPMSFGDLFERWTLVRSFGISKATPVGGVYNIPVTPSFPGVTLGRCFHTTAGYVGLPFQYWSGDMEYLIYIPSHPNIKGALQVFWDPSVFPTATTTYATDPTHLLSGTMIDLSGSSCTFVRVDMTGLTSSKFNEPVYSTGSTRAIDYCNGSLSFYLNAEVTTPRTDALVVTVLIFARGGKNMKFHVPKTFTSWGGENDQITLTNSTFRLQGLSEFDPSVESTDVVLAQGQGSTPVVQVHYGEDIASARGLVQKFSYAGTVLLENSTDVSKPRPFASLGFPQNSDYYSGQGHGYIPDTSALGFDPINPTGSVAQVWTWANHYLRLFCGYRGSHRIKLYHRDTGVPVDDTYPVHVGALVPNDIQSMGYVINALNRRTSIFTHESIQPISESAAGEYLIPFYSYQKYVSWWDLDITGGLDYPYAAKSARAFIWMPTGAFKVSGDQKSFDIYQAGGPDISVAHFRRVPGLIVAA
jgi:hypothetical protein